MPVHKLFISFLLQNIFASAHILSDILSEKINRNNLELSLCLNRFFFWKNNQTSVQIFMKLQCLKLLWGIVSTLEYSVFYRVENIFVWPFEKVQMAKVLFFNLGAVWVSEIISKRGAYHTHSWGPQNRDKVAGFF